MKPIAYPHASKQTRSTLGAFRTDCTTARRMLLTAALAIGLLAGCTKEKTNESGSGYTGETITVPVTLTPEFMGGVTVKSAGAAGDAAGQVASSPETIAAEQTASLPGAASFGNAASPSGNVGLVNSPYAPRSLMNVSAYTGAEAIAMAEAARENVTTATRAAATRAYPGQTAYGGSSTHPVTRSQTDVDESLVSDVWFVQLNAAGTAALQPPVYLSEGQLTGTRLPLELVGEQSMIYFLANSHDPVLMNTTAALSTFTKDAVEALSKTYTAATLESDLTAQGMPMAGLWTGIPSGDAIAVPLKRAVVKVTVNLSAELPSGHTFSPKFIQVCRVPSTLTLYRDAATATAPYPASSGAVVFTDYASEDISLAPITATPTSFVYYLPENARGTGTGTTQEEKTAAFAPGAAAEGPFCTYVQIIGHYDDGSGDELTRYTVFLGADNTSDYNLKRNNAYGVGITLKGGDPSYDVRITLLPIPIESHETDNTKLTLTYDVGAKGPFTVSDVSGLEWTVTSADPTWLKIATTAAATDAAESHIGTGIQTYYASAASENTGEPRSSEIVVSRFGPPEGRLQVTQNKKPEPSTITPLNLTIPAHANVGTVFYIDNKNSDLKWTLSSSDSWLVIADNENGKGGSQFLTGTGDATLFAYSPYLETTSTTATVTLARSQMASITLTVTRPAAVLNVSSISAIPLRGTGQFRVNASPGLKWRLEAQRRAYDVFMSSTPSGPFSPELTGDGSTVIYTQLQPNTPPVSDPVGSLVYLKGIKPGIKRVDTRIPFIGAD